MVFPGDGEELCPLCVDGCVFGDLVSSKIPRFCAGLVLIPTIKTILGYNTLVRLFHDAVNSRSLGSLDQTSAGNILKRIDSFAVAVHVEGHSVVLNFLRPGIHHIRDFSSGRLSGSLVITVVSVLELRRCNGDLGIGDAASALRDLVGLRLSARSGVHKHFTSCFRTDDRSAVLGSVQSTINCQSTVHIKLGIHQICSSPLRRSTIHSGISNRNQLLSGSRISAPLGLVIDIRFVTGCNAQRSTVCNQHFRTWQECRILVQRCRTGVDGNRNVAVDGQNVIACVQIQSSDHRKSGDSQRHGSDTEVAVHIKSQTVSSTRETLGQRAAVDIEHAAIADEDSACDKRLAAHVNGCIYVFCRSRVEGDWNFNVLDVVLGQREYLLTVIGHT